MESRQGVVERRTTERWSYLVLGVALLFIATVTLASMRRTSRTDDEGFHLRFGGWIVDGTLQTNLGQAMAINAVNALAARLTTRLVGPLDERTELFVARLPTVLASLLLAVFVFRWSRERHGLSAGILSLSCHALDPNLLGHGRLVANDVYCTTFCFLSVYLFLRYLERPRWHLLVATSTTFGLAQISKQSALLLIVAFPLLVIAKRGLGEFTPSRWSSRRTLRVAGHLLCFVFTVVLVINVGYGFHHTLTPLGDLGLGLPLVNTVAAAVPQLPVPFPLVWLQTLRFARYVNATGAAHGPTYLGGELTYGRRSDFFPTVFLLKTPLPVLALLALAIAATIRAGRRGMREELTLLITPIVFFAFFQLLCTSQIGFRYLLPLSPFLYVLVGRVAADRADDAASASPRLDPAWLRPTLIVLVLWQAASTLSYYPHFIAYLNELVPDRKMAYRYVADSNLDWGQSQLDLDTYLERPENHDVQVSPAGPTTGRVVVRVNELVGVLGGEQRYRWLRQHHTPVRHIGYAWLLFDVPIDRR